MGLIQVWKAKRRADRLMKALERAAENPDLYMDPEWQTEAAQRAADVIEVVPMPRPARIKAMNLLGLIQNVYKKPITTLAGVGIAYLEILQNGVTPKAALIALVGVLLGGTHPGVTAK